MFGCVALENDSSRGRSTSVLAIRFEKIPAPCRRPARKGVSDISRAPSVGQNRREPSSKFSLHLGQYISIDIAGHVCESTVQRRIMKALFQIGLEARRFNSKPAALFSRKY